MLESIVWQIGHWVMVFAKWLIGYSSLLKLAINAISIGKADAAS
ncbi:hypothetical protein MSIMFB_05726 [Mycobacterium simulans]|uniref:Uncharacterized protein n=1 Tax=Mycobacterium simulans TaxID=627089 RepID=A0A7Z7NCR4_9MYCO|nr:hypothetical protein [Mycobacterium simulans]SOK27506.1 hypothetical protein MSIMFB_05726 [Mycobacterium simulans]